MIWHSQPIEDIINDLGTDINTGLTENEANDRLLTYGRNEKPLNLKKDLKHLVLSQLKNPTNIILVALLCIYCLKLIVLSQSGFSLPILLLIILIIKMFTSIVLQNFSLKMVKLIQSNFNATAHVLRDGKEQIIDASEVVPGDIIFLTNGSYIPADARIIYSEGLRCDESIITGDEMLSEKYTDGETIYDHSPIHARYNSIYSGCSVVFGSGVAIVTDTGENTEMGRQVFTASKISIERKIRAQYSNYLKIFSLSIAAILVVSFLIGVFVLTPSFSWSAVLNILIFSFCLIVAVIPNSFTDDISTLMCYGIINLKAQNIIIKEQDTLEKLSTASYICTDKTGVLTRNIMSLNQIYDNKDIISVNMVEDLNDTSAKVLKYAALACDDKPANDIIQSNYGDPTEAAIIKGCKQLLNIDKSRLDNELPRTNEIPFTSERRLKSTVNIINGTPHSIVKGDPMIILNTCSTIDYDAALSAYTEMSSIGLRVLGIAYKVLDNVPLNPTQTELETDLVFLGFVGVSDKNRKGVKNDLEECQNAGINTMIFTGDTLNTAISSVKNIGFSPDAIVGVCGQEISELNDIQLSEKVKHFNVCSATNIEDRTRIVKALHNKGETVAVTADSISNIGAVKYADIGFAMGKTGSDVAKSYSDVIITNDKFSSILHTIRGARAIFDNISKYLQFIIAFAASLLFVNLFGICFTQSLVLSPQQILVFSIFSCVFPIISFGYDSAENSIMNYTPSQMKSNLFGYYDVLKSIAFAFVISVFSLISRLLVSNNGACYLTLFLSFILLFYSIHNKNNPMFSRILNNKSALIISCSFLMLIIILLLIPYTNSKLFLGISTKQSMVSVAFSLISLAVVEALKFTPILNQKN